MESFDHKKVEEKWKKHWYTDNIYEAVDFSPKPKKYILAELPYPSGAAIHIGHAMRYTVPEVYSRYLRMQGYNVMFPMGWDAFGLPTEGFALKSGKTPQEVTEELGKSYKQAMMDIGYGIDWSRCFSTTDPEYYKWTQWLFLKFYENGLAQLREMPVWWCKELGNLADEEILTDKDGNKISERGSHKVERKLFRQWVLKIPEYAEQLLTGLDTVDFPEAIKNAQINWIGKSEGALVDFETENTKLTVFTTRPDTIMGVSFIAISPEHPILNELIEQATNQSEIREYVSKTKNMSNLERQTTKEKTGVQLFGVSAKHPFKELNREVPVYVANYILMDYGTGVVMGVPAGDERDREFAEKYNIKIIDYSETEEFGEEVISRLEKESKGQRKTVYKIRDWVFSRQHYWGEPIPVVYKQDGTTEALTDSKDLNKVNQVLPLELPYSKEYEPMSDGSAPLARLSEWVNTTDSIGNPAIRETQTMPTWAGSSWYFLRYIDPHNSKEFASQEKLNYWLPVDKYFGGAEHTTVHLLYSRFWHKFFYDQGIVPTPEPYAWRLNGGLLLASDGRKMSKRFGNVVEPGELIEKFGADATRLSIVFLGPYEDTYPWNENGIKAMNKFIKTIISLKDKVSDTTNDKEFEKSYHKMVQKVTDMLENLKLNTCVSEFMIFVNMAKNQDHINKDMWLGFLKLLAPFIPFVAEDLWQDTNGYTSWSKENSVHLQEWPKFDETLVVDDLITLPIQVNGKVRSQVVVEANTPDEDIKKFALNDEKIQKFINGQEIKNYFYVKGKIINIVI